jgi:histidyl-tRNA synthetase
MDYDAHSLKSQMRIATKSNAKTVVIIGEEELSRGVLKVKNMATGLEVDVKEENLVEYIKSVCGR